MATAKNKYKAELKSSEDEINLITCGYPPKISIENEIVGDVTPFPDDFTYVNTNIPVGDVCLPEIPKKYVNASQAVKGQKTLVRENLNKSPTTKMACCKILRSDLIFTNVAKGVGVRKIAVTK